MKQQTLAMAAEQGLGFEQHRKPRRRAYGDSTYASQKDLIAARAPKARDFTNQRTRRSGTVDEQARANSHHNSRIRARVKHVFGVVKRLWGFGKVRYQGLVKNAMRAFTARVL